MKTLKVPVFVAAACAASIALAPALACAQKLVILVRHAERADGGVTTPGMMAPADPLLSAEGQARAAKLAAMLADSGITAVFATQYRRTQDTAKPLATKLGLKVQNINASDTAALVSTMKRDHANGVVLVVGHSNSVPNVIKALGGPDVTIADDEYSGLFILVPSTGALTKIRF